MGNDKDSGASGPGKSRRDPLDAGLRAAFGPGRQPDSTQPVIEALGVGDSRVMLRDPPGEHTPVVTPRSAELEPGESSAGRYRILGEIGQGGVGVIFKARDIELGRDVALKLLRRELEENPLIVERFVEEAQVGAQLQHPGVVPVYELGLMADRRPYFTMKLVKGQTLAALLADREGPADGLRRLLTIFEQICQTMAYAHARDVVHRDLKPSNVMLGAFREVQIVDWGFAKVGRSEEMDHLSKEGYTQSQISIIETIRSVTPASESMVGSVMGTPAYMPPEQARGDIEKLDPRSDVFALGAILCEILTGLPPYTGETNKIVLYKAARGRLDDALGRLTKCRADARLVRLAGECLSPARNARPPDAGVLAREVGDYLASEEAEARRAQIAAEAAKVRALQERKGRRLTLAVAGAVLLAMLAVGAVTLWMTKTSRMESQAALEAFNAALDEADVHRRSAEAGETIDLASLERALEAAKRAQTLAREAEDGESDRDRADELVADLGSRISELRSAAEREARDRAMLGRIVELRACRCPQRDPRAIDEAFAAAFRDYGADPGSSAPSETASRIRESEIRDDLCDALAAWIAVRVVAGGEAGGAAVHLEVLRHADPDPMRVEIRAAAFASAPGTGLEQLRRVAERAKGGSPPARTLALLGECLCRAGAVEEAVELLTAATLRYPKDFWNHYQLASITARLDPAARRAAHRHCAAARSLRPESGEMADVVGTVVADLGGTERAIGMWRRGVAASEDPALRVHLLAHVADTLRSAGRLNEASAAVREAEDAGEPDAYLWRVKGRLYLEKRFPAKAVEALDRAVSLWPAFGEAHRDRIRAYEAAGRLGDVLRETEVEAARSPGQKRLWMRLGLCRSLAGDLDGAVRAYEEACARDPLNADCLVALGRTRLEAGNLDAAIETLRQATGLAPGRTDAQQSLGVALAAKGEMDAAVRELTSALREARPAAATLTDLGIVLMRKGDPHGAAHAFQSALRIDPDHARARLGLGEHLLRLQENGPAITELRRAFGADPDCLCALRFLMLALRRTRGLAGEIESLRREAIRRSRDADCQMLLGAALEESGSAEDACAAYRKAAGLRGAPAGAHVLLGLALERQGRVDEALECYRKAVRLHPQHPEARCRLGLALLERGKFDSAIAQIRRGHGGALCSPGLLLPTRIWLEEAQRMQELGTEIPALLRGDGDFPSARTHAEAARLLSRSGRPAEAAPLFAKAFENNPSLVWDPIWDNARRAATAALLRGEATGDAGRARWRDTAIRWLREAMAFVPERLARGDHREVLNTLQSWRQEKGLAAIRDESALAVLSDEERQKCRALWEEAGRLADEASRD